MKKRTSGILLCIFLMIMAQNQTFFVIGQEINSLDDPINDVLAIYPSNYYTSPAFDYIDIDLFEYKIETDKSSFNITFEGDIIITKIFYIYIYEFTKFTINDGYLLTDYYVKIYNCGCESGNPLVYFKNETGIYQTTSSYAGKKLSFEINESLSESLNIVSYYLPEENPDYYIMDFAPNSLFVEESEGNDDDDNGKIDEDLPQFKVEYFILFLIILGISLGVGIVLIVLKRKRSLKTLVILQN